MSGNTETSGTTDRARTDAGTAAAAFLAAGIGSFAMGLIVILNEAGIYSAPAIYGPSGGVSGRTTIAVVVWLISWGVLHSRWKGKSEPDVAKVHGATIALIALGLVMLLPPVWKLFG